MTEILAFLATNLGSLFKDNWFRITNSRVGYRFAIVVLESHHSRLEIVDDPDFISMRLQPLESNRSEWFLLSVVRRLYGERPTSDRLDSDAIAFLRAKLPEIDAAFGSPVQRDELLGKLRDEKSVFAEERFGSEPQTDLTRRRSPTVKP